MSGIAVIYARYSSANQRDVSIEQQVNACRKYAQSQNLDVIHVYDDHAMTGTNDNRPQFLQMIKDSSTRAFQFVIVPSHHSLPLRRATDANLPISPATPTVSSQTVGTFVMNAVHSGSVRYCVGESQSICIGASKSGKSASWWQRVP